MSEIRTIEVPKWGLTMDEGTLSQWLISVGDSFRKGDELCEIETSKIANALEASFDGVLRRIVAQPGDTLPVGGLLGLAAPLSVSDEALDAWLTEHHGGVQTASAQTASAQTASVQTAPSVASQPETKTPAVDISAAAENTSAAKKSTGIPEALRAAPGAVADTPATRHARRLAETLGINLAAITGSGREARISVTDIEEAVRALGGSLPETPAAPRANGPAPSKADDSAVPATPLARRLARQWQINLHDCRASGSRGRVGKADVEAVRAQRDPAPQAPAPGVPATPEYEVQPLSGMRKAIAARLQASKRNAPHFRVTTTLDMTALLALRAEINATVPGVKVSVNDMLIKASAQALMRCPAVNVQFDEEAQQVRRFHDADIAVAVALEGGLITPIVRAAQQKSLAAIAAEVRELVTHAKAGTLRPEQFQGGTFSLSNLGMFGVQQFDAIINPPQAAILAIGASSPQVVVRDGAMVIREQMTVSLSCDHRVIDGALGGAFLQELKRLVESPALMIV